MTERAKGFGTKWVLSGFPKSGLHLLVGYLLPLARPQNDDQGVIEGDWAGTFRDSSWTNRWMPMEQVCFKLGRVTDHHFLRAHLGYKGIVDSFLYYLGVAHVFVYRDLRDVAVSQSHHILNPDAEKYPHPEKEALCAMEFLDVLRAVIEGYGKCPGIIDRWALYERWLQTRWTLLVRFEDLIGDREAQAERILTYGLARLGSIWGREMQLSREGAQGIIEAMADSSLNTAQSFTYRRGEAGTWREVFTPELCDLFRRLDDGHLKRAGYDWSE